MWISLNRIGKEFWTMATTSCIENNKFNYISDITTKNSASYYSYLDIVDRELHNMVPSKTLLKESSQ
jgi:hypothetical protein